MTAHREKSNHNGFTIIELIIVIALIAIMMTVGLLYWRAIHPVLLLDNTANTLASFIRLGKTNAAATKNNWFLELYWEDVAVTSLVDGTIEHIGLYALVNDDGWNGTGDRHYTPFISRNYFDGEALFPDMRNNGICDAPFERHSGPFPLQTRIVFIDDPGWAGWGTTRKFILTPDGKCNPQDRTANEWSICIALKTVITKDGGNTAAFIRRDNSVSNLTKSRKVTVTRYGRVRVENPAAIGH